MSDITRQILDEHDWFRRAFADLDETRDDEELGALWELIEGRLELHAEAEETIFYPVLLQRGDNAEEETDDAIGDHDKIRAASQKTHGARVGSQRWWDAVTEARVQNSDHMAEEERGALADFRRNTTAERRHELGVRFAGFIARRNALRVPRDYEGPDPDDYIERHSPSEG